MNSLTLRLNLESDVARALLAQIDAALKLAAALDHLTEAKTAAHSALKRTNLAVDGGRVADAEEELGRAAYYLKEQESITSERVALSAEYGKALTTFADRWVAFRTYVANRGDVREIDSVLLLLPEREQDSIKKCIQSAQGSRYASARLSPPNKPFLSVNPPHVCNSPGPPRRMQK